VRKGIPFISTIPHIRYSPARSRSHSSSPKCLPVPPCFANSPFQLVIPSSPLSLLLNFLLLLVPLPESQTDDSRGTSSNNTHLELGIETSGLVRTTRNLVGLGVGPWSARHSGLKRVARRCCGKFSLGVVYRLFGWEKRSLTLLS
jgi:hypothetical protein